MNRTHASQGSVLASAADAIGGTPIVALDRLVADTADTFGPPERRARVLLKMEGLNPLGSVKDRIGRAMIDAALGEGTINPDTRIIEPTSGNTGIALAFVCAARGLALTLCMPESMSLERRAVLRHLGAELELTPAEKGMSGALARAQELVEVVRTNRGRSAAFMPQQFENPANPRIHEQTTGPEIERDTAGNVDAIIAGVGTGGTITGVTRHMRRVNPSFLAFAVEPVDSAVISGCDPGPHKIQGIGAGFIPRNLDVSLLSDVLRVANDDAFKWARRLAAVEGIPGGISTGANVRAALSVGARPEMAGKTIVTICCSLAERYLSTPLFDRDDADLGANF